MGQPRRRRLRPLSPPSRAPSGCSRPSYASVMASVPTSVAAVVAATVDGRPPSFLCSPTSCHVLCHRGMRRRHFRPPPRRARLRWRFALLHLHMRACGAPPLPAPRLPALACTADSHCTTRAFVLFDWGGRRSRLGPSPSLQRPGTGACGSRPLLLWRAAAFAPEPQARERARARARARAARASLRV
jgi:hypothetical protein